MAEYRKKFIALDLETTHLDPEEGRIMEVGAIEVEIFFDRQENQVKVNFGESFQTLVNPEIDTSPTSLELTEILPEELNRAPLWPEVKAKLQGFLQDEILLGHNLGFDLEFLKNQGLSLKNKFFDTLEIAQTFLPLLPVHSLEYLAQEFGLDIKASHRALTDSQASALLLCQIVNQFLGFPASLQEEIKSQLSSSKSAYRDLFLSLPQIELEISSLQKPGKFFEKPKDQKRETELEFPDKTIISLPLSLSWEQDWLIRQAGLPYPVIMAISHFEYLDLLPEKQIITSPFLALCEKRLNWLKNQENPPEISHKVFIKIAIFRHFCPKSFDLSKVRWAKEEKGFLSRILTRVSVCPVHQCRYFKSLKAPQKQSFFTDLPGLFNLVNQWKIDFSDFKLILFDLAYIEDVFTDCLLETWSLTKIRNYLNLVYPIDQEDEAMIPRIVLAVANELDLFFGILHLVYYKKDVRFAENLVIDSAERESGRFQKLFFPVEKLLGKLENLRQYLGEQIASKSDEEKLEFESLAEKVSKYIIFLNEFFFSYNKNQIYWFRFESAEVELNIVPKDIKEPFAEMKKRFKSLTIVDTKLPGQSLSYFKQRFGIADWEVVHPRVFLPCERKVNVKIFSQTLSLDAIAELVKNKNGRILVVVPNETKLFEIYEKLLKMKSSESRILAYRFSGNLHSLRSKFQEQEKDNIVLLLTTNSYLRFFKTLPPCKYLIVIKLPFEAPGSSRQVFVDPASQDKFKDYALPRAIHLLHTMVARFLASSQEQQEIYLLDNRVEREYDGAFLKYFEEFPDFWISTA